MDFSSSSDEDESRHLSCDAALRNPLILERIFTHRPTRRLLSSCSLVNKLWNREACSFIRDHWICLQKPVASLENPCKLILHLDGLCCKTTARGRQISWNGFQMSFYTFGCSSKKISSSDDQLETALHIKSDMKVRYLEIYWYNSYFQECKVHLPLQALLRQCAPDLVTLKFENWSPESGQLLSSYISVLPKLEEFAVSNSHLDADDEPSLMQFVRRVVECSPNLKRIVPKTVKDLAMFPEEAYPLLKKLDFFVRNRQDVCIYQKVIQKRPALRELVISEYWSPSYGLDNENDDDSLERNFCTALGLLLEACSHSLNKMVVRWSHALENGLSFPLLVNLRKLTFMNGFDCGIGGLWNFIASIDYDQYMPNLEKLQLVICTVDPENRKKMPEIAHVTWPDPNPDVDHHPVRPPCSTSATLKLKLDLEELKMLGHDAELGRNYDADLCGIHLEEVNWLKLQSDEYLKNVNIVPLRPCLLTMSNLRKVYITMGFNRKPGKTNGPEEVPPVEFISRVTELVVLRQVENTTVRGYICSDSDYD